MTNNRYEITESNREAVNYCKELLQSNNKLKNVELREKVREKMGKNLHNSIFGIIRRELGLKQRLSNTELEQSKVKRKYTKRKNKVTQEQEINNAIQQLEPEVIHGEIIPPDLHHALVVVSDLLKRYNFAAAKIENDANTNQNNVLLFPIPKQFRL